MPEPTPAPQLISGLLTPPLEAWTRNTEHPHIPNPGSAHVLAADVPCVECPQATNPDHTTAACIRLTEPVPTTKRLPVQFLRDAQFLVNRLSEDSVGLAGDRFPLNQYEGLASINYADSNTLTVASVEPHPEGSKIICFLPNGQGGFSDIGGLPIYLVGVAKPQNPLARTVLPIFGTIQPGDRVRANFPSPAANKTFASVLRLRMQRFATPPPSNVWPPPGPPQRPLQTVPALELIIDQDLSESLMSDVRLDPSPPVPATIRIWREAGARPAYTEVISPVATHYSPRRLDIRTNEIPQSGLVTLPVPIPGSRVAPPRSQWQFRAMLNATTDITATVAASLRQISTGPGADGRGTYVATINLQSYIPANPNTTPSNISIRYMSESTPEEAAGPGGCHSAAKICAHCVPLRCGSRYDPNHGAAVDSATGLQYTCRQLATWQIVEDFNANTHRVEYTKPSGLPWFTAHCSLIGVCDRYIPQDESGTLYDYRRTPEQILRELWGGINTRRDQFIPGLDIPQNYRLRRIHGPSLAHLHGQGPLLPPTGPWERLEPVHYPAGFTLPATIETDGDGNERLVFSQGLAYAGHGNLPDWSQARVQPNGTISGQIPPPGPVASAIMDPTTPTALGNPETDQTDPAQGRRRHSYRQARRTTMNTGQRTGRGLAARTRHTGPNETLIIPRLATFVPEVQIRHNGLFLALPAPGPGPGNIPVQAVLELRRLQHDLLGPIEIATATVARAITTTNNGIPAIAIDLVNQPRTYTTTQVVNNDLVRVDLPYHAGGHAVQPPDGCKVRNIGDPEPTLGSPADKTIIGDAIAYSGDITDLPGSADWRWCILEARAFGGLPAPDWGPGGAAPPENLAPIPGYGGPNGYAKQRDRIIHADPEGHIARMLAQNPTALNGRTVTIYRRAITQHPATVPVLSSEPDSSGHLQVTNSSALTLSIAPYERPQFVPLPPSTTPLGYANLQLQFALVSNTNPDQLPGLDQFPVNPAWPQTIPLWLPEHGRGRAYLTPMALNLIPEVFCAKLSA